MSTALTQLHHHTTARAGAVVRRDHSPSGLVRPYTRQKDPPHVVPTWPIMALVGRRGNEVTRDNCMSNVKETKYDKTLIIVIVVEVVATFRACSSAPHLDQALS